MDAVNADFQLLIDVRTFRLVAPPRGTAEVELAGKILDAQGRVIAARVFAASTGVDGEATAVGVAALDQAFSKVGSELIAWAVSTMSEQSNRTDAPKAAVPKKAATP
jgi:phospholipid/cholesterol/gamma-HCH transport system substrate-binding protein